MSKTKQNIHPTGDRLVIERLPSEQKTASGIVIPDSAADKPDQGVVVAVGPGKRHPETNNVIPISLKVGDKVLFGKYSGSEVVLGDSKYLIVREDDVMATIVD